MGVTLDKPVFSPEFFRELASENPFGLKLHWREVEAWFNFIAWPAYKTYNYTQHQRAIRRWWARACTMDLERAREALENTKFARAEDEQSRITATDILDGPPNHDVIHKVFGGRGGEPR